MILMIVAILVRVAVLFLVPETAGTGELTAWVRGECIMGNISDPYPRVVLLRWFNDLGLSVRVPAIMADIAITYLLYKKVGRWAWVYALNPFVINISAVMGMVESIAVLPAVLAVVTGWGWANGLSFKIFTPAYLLAWHPKYWWGFGFTLLAWLAGYLVWGKHVLFEYSCGGLGWGYNFVTSVVYKYTGWGLEMLEIGKIILLVGLLSTAWFARKHVLEDRVLLIALCFPLFAPFWAGHYYMWSLPFFVLSKRKIVIPWTIVLVIGTFINHLGSELQADNLFRMGSVAFFLSWLIILYWYVKEMRNDKLRSEVDSSHGC